MLEIKNKIEIEENIWVGEVDSSAFNSSQEARIKAVTDIGSICYGRLGFNDECSKCFSGKADISYDECPICGRKHLDSKSISRKRLNLYNRLKVESNNNASTAFEFIPVKIEERSLYKFLNYDSIKMVNKVYKYSYLINEDGTEYLLTNMRTLLKAGIKEEDIPFNTPEELEGFKVVIGNIPWKALYHIDRSRAFVFMEETSRNKKFRENIKFWIDKSLPIWQQTALRWASKKSFQLSQWLIDKGIRAEIANMFIPDNRLVTFGMSSWEQDKNSWNNLFETRKDKTGTMNITGQVVNAIKNIL